MAGVARAHQPYSHRMLARQAPKPKSPSAGGSNDFALRRAWAVKTGGLPARPRLGPQMRKVAPIEM